MVAQMDNSSSDDFVAPDTARFLSRFAPDLVKVLRERYPTASAVLRGDGTVLGQGDDELSVDAARAFLGRVKDAALDAMTQTGARLRLANRFDLIGGVLASSSTAGVVVAALGSNSPWGPAVLGLIGFIASAVPLAARWLRAATTGHTAVAFQQLREAAWDADALRAELDRAEGGDTKKQIAMVKRANAIAKRAYLALIELGYEPSFGAV